MLGFSIINFESMLTTYQLQVLVRLSFSVDSDDERNWMFSVSSPETCYTFLEPSFATLCLRSMISERLKDSLQLEIPLVEGFYILITNLKLT